LVHDFAILKPSDSTTHCANAIRKTAMPVSATRRALRGVALGRGNYLFMGSDAGGERAASIYSLVETAFALCRLDTAWRRNHRYRLVTRWLARTVLTLVLLGAALKLMMAIDVVA